MKVLFVAGFGPIVADMSSSNHFYAGSLGIPLEGDDTYQTTEAVEGINISRSGRSRLRPSPVSATRIGRKIFRLHMPGSSSMSRTSPRRRRIAGEGLPAAVG